MKPRAAPDSKEKPARPWTAGRPLFGAGKWFAQKQAIPAYRVAILAAMDWTDPGIVLSARPHGETSAVVTLLTRARGRHAGLVRGGAGKRVRGILQPGNLVDAHWRARLAEHLGTMTCELSKAYTATVLDDADRLAALSAACAVAEAALPEREAYPAVYDGFIAFLETLSGEAWPTVYVRWELGLLGELGFGLDLTECAATGGNDQLAYVSPKSGRAVSLAAGEPYRNRLLALPQFLINGGGAATLGEAAAGLDLTGFFLERYVFVHRRQGMPAARQRLAQRLRAADGSPTSP